MWTTAQRRWRREKKASESIRRSGGGVCCACFKLRTMVSARLEQYKDKNIGDAESVAEGGDNLSGPTSLCATRRYPEPCGHRGGSTDSFKTSDRSAIIDVLKEMQDMINSEGNSTYAGRYIFLSRL
ncbi:MAG: hypothetical protein ACLUGQ_02025 [Coprococcus sp.]